jgi:hypothetical protein
MKLSRFLAIFALTFVGVTPFALAKDQPLSHLGVPADDIAVLITENDDGVQLIKWDVRSSSFVEFVVPDGKAFVLTDISLVGGSIVGVLLPQGGTNFFLNNLTDESFTGGLVIGPGASFAFVGEPLGHLLGYFAPLE